MSRGMSIWPCSRLARLYAVRPWRRKSTSSIMHFIVAMPCECGEGRPDGCERECRGGEGSVGEASCFWRAFVVVGDARSCDEKPVGVDAVWGAGHKGGLIGAGVVFVYPGEIVGGDGARCAVMTVWVPAPPIGRDVPSQCPAPMASVCSLVPWRMGRLMPSFG